MKQYSIYICVLVSIMIFSCSTTQQVSKLTAERDSLKASNEKLLKAMDDFQLRNNDLYENLQETKIENDYTSQVLMDKQQKVLDQGGDLKMKRLENGLLRTRLQDQRARLDTLRMGIVEALLDFSDDSLFTKIVDDKVYLTLPEKVLFDRSSAKLNNKSRKVLQRVARVLRENKSTQIIVEGHTDNIPTTIYEDNWELSLARAASVTRLFVQQDRYRPPKDHTQWSVLYKFRF